MANLKIDQKHLEGIENLINQSLGGVHALFDSNDVARILRTPTEDLDFFNFDNMELVQETLGELMAKDDLHEKRCYIADLEPERLEALVRAYFHILETTIVSSSQYTH